MISSQTDEELSNLACKEPEAFSELYHRHVDSVYRYHLARTGRVQDAEDLTAQTFLSALENLHHYQKRSPFIYWLFGIARHKLADFYRHQNKNISSNTGSASDENSSTVEEIIDQDLSIDDIAHALQSLIPDRREALVLRLISGLSAWEIGQMMGKSEMAIKMLVQRGLKDLQERFTEVSKS
jgi:RNA polymerase sigma-70 factor (ECF subfamily)